MNKYMLFYGYGYYANGGWEDFKGSFDTLQDAKEFFSNNEKDPCFMWAHIVKSDKIILTGSLGLGRDQKWKWEEAESDK